MFVDLEDFLLRDEDLGAAKEVILLVEARLVVDAAWEDFYLAVDQQSWAEGALIGSAPVQLFCEDRDGLDEALGLSDESFVAVTKRGANLVASSCLGFLQIADE